MYNKVNQLYIHIYPLFFRFFSHKDHWVEFPVLYSRSLLVIYIAVCICQSQSPNLYLPPSAFPPMAISLFSLSVALFLFCKYVPFLKRLLFNIMQKTHVQSQGGERVLERPQDWKLLRSKSRWKDESFVLDVSWSLHTRVKPQHMRLTSYLLPSCWFCSLVVTALFHLWKG